jgi:hypothetical protein
MLGHSKKREAIRECKRLWRAIENSGEKSKYDFLYSKEGKIWLDKNLKWDCPLCNFSNIKQRDDKNCLNNCPLVKQYGLDCCELGWNDDRFTPEWLEKIYGLKE